MKPALRFVARVDLLACAIHCEVTPPPQPPPDWAFSLHFCFAMLIISSPSTAVHVSGGSQRVTLVVAFTFLPQNFGMVVRTYECLSLSRSTVWIVSTQKCGENTQNCTHCNWICLNILHSEAVWMLKHCSCTPTLSHQLVKNYTTKYFVKQPFNVSLWTTKGPTFACVR